MCKPRRTSLKKAPQRVPTSQRQRHLASVATGLTRVTFDLCTHARARAVQADQIVDMSASCGKFGVLGGWGGVFAGVNTTHPGGVAYMQSVVDQWVRKALRLARACYVLYLCARSVPTPPCGRWRANLWDRAHLLHRGRRMAPPLSVPHAPGSARTSGALGRRRDRRGRFFRRAVARAHPGDKIRLHGVRHPRARSS